MPITPLEWSPSEASVHEQQLISLEEYEYDGRWSRPSSTAS